MQKHKSKNPAAVALGTLGGKSKSDNKINASKVNGKKGGRPLTHLDHCTPDEPCLKCIKREANNK